LSFVLLAAGAWFAGCQAPDRAASEVATAPAAAAPLVRAHAVLTVAESKRLIARGVAQMPVVQKALQHGTVIVCKGTTNTYVAEELLGRKIPHGPFVIGNITPEKGGGRLPKMEPTPEVVIVKGQHRPDMTLDEALKLLAPGDVVIKGGNALDYANRTAAVWTGSSTGGTTGKIKPAVTASGAHLLIPIGLEKQVSGRVAEIVEKVNQAADNLTNLPRMQMLPGEIVTEIEALRTLANVQAFQASAGGIGGAEGAVWLVWRGRREDVEKARHVVSEIQGEEPFIR